MSFQFLHAEVGGWLSLLVTSCGIGAVGGPLDTCDLCLSLAQYSRTFHRALTFTTESLASPAHADGQHWEGGRQAGVEERTVFY